MSSSLVNVNQTKQALKQRIAEHKTDIHTNNLEYAMSHQHYVNVNHKSASALKFWGIENTFLFIYAVTMWHCLDECNNDREPAGRRHLKRQHFSDSDGDMLYVAVPY